MHIVCPECGKDHEVADDKLPGPKFKAICRQCGMNFMVAGAPCPACGAQNQEGHHCPCAAADLGEVLQGVAGKEDFSGLSAAEAELAVVGDGQQDSQLPSEPKQAGAEHCLLFTGSGGEYFRIWIVNLFLTIITLGIYAAWAKVRTRQYFYTHTSCAGEPFDYLADPTIILRGNLIVGGAFLLYMLTNAFTPLVSSMVVLLFGLLFPLLVFKSLRFYGRNSAYRNIRFHFLGTLEESYITYLLLPILLPFSLGLLFPYWAYRRKKYFFGNFAFGNQPNSFTGLPADFYKIYIKAFVLVMLPVAAILMVLGVIGAMAMGMHISSLEGMAGGVVVAIFVMVYVGLFLATIFAQQYVYAKVTNYCWGSSTLGSVTFRSSLAAGTLMWIRLSNILALLLSAGLLFPWTKVRQRRYILENLTVITSAGLDDFGAGEEDREDALGEATMDFFDFEVGL